MWIVDAKAYYVFGIYPALFAAGSTQIEKWFNKNQFGYIQLPA